MLAVTATSHSSSSRLFWLVIGAALGFVIREVWDWYRRRTERLRRERALLTALAREVFVIRAVAAAVVQDINREREHLAEGLWRLKPLLLLPTSLLGLARGGLPTRLLEQDGFGQIAALQTQCEFTNQVAAAQYAWKTPMARGLEDQLQIIADFHPALEESVLAVAQRCDQLIKTLETSASHFGGLDVTRTDDRA